jgi:hypothetical protein
VLLVGLVAETVSSLTEIVSPIREQLQLVVAVGLVPQQVKLAPVI